MHDSLTRSTELTFCGAQSEEKPKEERKANGETVRSENFLKEQELR